MPTHYEVDFYGSMADGINDGDETDRFEVDWDLTRPVAARSADRRGRPAACCRHRRRAVEPRGAGRGRAGRGRRYRTTSNWPAGATRSWVGRGGRRCATPCCRCWTAAIWSPGSPPTRITCCDPPTLENEATMRPTRIDGFETRVLRIPLVSPFTTSFGTETVREVIVIRAVTADGEGWGECVTQHTPAYSSEYTEGAWDVLHRFVYPTLLTAREVRPEQVGTLLDGIVGHRMPKAAVELALLDAGLQAAGESFAHYLGAERDRVPSGVSVGIQDSLDELRRDGRRLPRRGLRADQAQDPARLGHRTDPADPPHLRRRPAAPGGRERGLHPGRRPAAARTRPVRPAADRAAARRGRPATARGTGQAAAAHRSASTNR